MTNKIFRYGLVSFIVAILLSYGGLIGYWVSGYCTRPNFNSTNESCVSQAIDDFTRDSINLAPILISIGVAIIAAISVHANSSAQAMKRSVLFTLFIFAVLTAVFYTGGGGEAFMVLYFIIGGAILALVLTFVVVAIVRWLKSRSEFNN